MDSGIAKRFEKKRDAADLPTLRVGGIDYLNALPLTEYLSLDGTPRIELRNLVPSALAAGLRAGELDVALVPVVEYLERDDYLIIPDICVSSYGAVESIRFYHRAPLEALQRVALDTSSRTSALLTRLLLRAHWRSRPEILPIEPAAALRYLAAQEPAPGSARAGALDDLDAVLLIGDPALGRDAPTGWRSVDLGNEWTRLTGLPFVYAFWVCRADSCPGGTAASRLADRFRRARDLGLSRIDDIIRRYLANSRGVDAADAARAAGGNGGGGPRVSTWEGEARLREYLSRVIQYELGPAQLEGLQLFFSRLGREGLHDGAPRPLRFVGGSS